MTQGGADYAGPTGSMPLAEGLNNTSGVAVDAAGNVYVADASDNSIQEWNASTQTVSTVVSAGLNDPHGLAVDASGNVYIADTNDGAIKVWNPSTQMVSTLIASGLNSPEGVAVDASGNVYVADTNDGAIKEWNASTQTVSTLVSSGLNGPDGVAVDASGNVYIADANNAAVKVFNASTGEVGVLISSGLKSPYGVAVDASGNVYVADAVNNEIEEWNAVTGTMGTLSGFGSMAVDALGNVYVAAAGDIMETLRAFVPTGAVAEGAGPGSDALSPVLPGNERLPMSGIFALTSDQAWLTIGSVSGGVVNFSFTANSGLARTAHIMLLGHQVAVTQAGAISLATSSLLEGPAAASDSDIVGVAGAWSAASNAPWLHTTSSGSGGGLATFSFDANTGATRTGTLTVAGQTLTVTQAAAGYEAASLLTTPATGLNNPSGVAVDASGNVYYAGVNSIQEWNASTQTVSTVVSSGLNDPHGLAVDAAGNVYIADAGDDAIKVWNASTRTVSTLVSSGLNRPYGVAVDASGNVYIADTYDDVWPIKEWKALTHTVVNYSPSTPYPLDPMGLAMDALGNVYIVGGFSGVIKWNPATGAWSNLNFPILPTSVAVDASGNVYGAVVGVDQSEEWNASTQTFSTLSPSGSDPEGIAVDASGNVYIADTFHDVIVERPRAFVTAGAVIEKAGAGSDALPPVLPISQPLTGVFAPASDQNWLTIGSVSGGVVNFSFTANSGLARTAHITLLGQQIAVTQAGSPPGNLGVFSAGYWYRDMNGDNQWTSADGNPLTFGWKGATPVAGDWDGSGKTEVGVYNSGTWWLDTSTGVQTFSFGFAGSNVFPVVGDWNGDGKTEVGVYCNGAWFRDVDGTHAWDAANQAALAYLGWNDGGTNTVVPVPGCWAGDGKTEMGVYCNGVWFLDSTGTNKYDGTYSYWGWSSPSSPLIPVAGDWSGSGTKDQFGVYSQGVWFRDADGTHQWDAANQAAVAYLGWAGAQPAVGDWYNYATSSPQAARSSKAAPSIVAEGLPAAFAQTVSTGVQSLPLTAGDIDRWLQAETALSAPGATEQPQTVAAQQPIQEARGQIAAALRRGDVSSIDPSFSTLASTSKPAKYAAIDPQAVDRLLIKIFPPER